ncbi:Hypothetical protein AKI40_2529 [Enterobacter sp. FY-07]|nr:Hypothetical protein AKI40_2529 [Enterobacter sp. FY-07]
MINNKLVKKHCLLQLDTFSQVSFFKDLRGAYRFRLGNISQSAGNLLQDITECWLDRRIPLSLVARGADKGSALTS